MHWNFYFYNVCPAREGVPREFKYLITSMRSISKGLYMRQIILHRPNESVPYDYLLLGVTTHQWTLSKQRQWALCSTRIYRGFYYQKLFRTSLSFMVNVLECHTNCWKFIHTWFIRIILRWRITNIFSKHRVSQC